MQGGVISPGGGIYAFEGMLSEVAASGKVKTDPVGEVRC